MTNLESHHGVTAAVPLTASGAAVAAPASVTVRSEIGRQATSVDRAAGQSFSVTHRSGRSTVGKPTGAGAVLRPSRVASDATL